MLRRPSPQRLASSLGNRAFTSLVGRSRTLARFRDAEAEDVPLNLTELDTGPIELTGSVGRGGQNDAGDVAAVRTRLETLGYVTGDSIDSLASAIEAYQRDVLAFKHPDGRADPGGMTVAGLSAGRTSPRRDDPAPPTPPQPTPPQPDPNPPAPGKLGAGDHVWYWNGQVSTDKDIPRLSWFPSSSGASDYLGHGKEIFQFVVYPDHVKRGQPHMRSGPGTYSWINNNPGNLTAGGVNVGEYPGKRNWHNFIVFPTREAGFDAIPRFLKANGYGPLGIAAAFRRYAPSGDGINNPETYAQRVVDAIGGGVTTETKINELTDDQMREVQNAIAKMEGAIKGDELARDDPRIPPEVRALL